MGKDAVIIESTLSCDEASKILKDATGGTAILWGFGGMKLSFENILCIIAKCMMIFSFLDSNAAVAIVEGSGIKGVVRFGTSKENGSLIDGTIDGLPMGEHNLQIHVAGDISQV